MEGMLSRYRREQIIMALMGDAAAYRIPRRDGGVGNKWRCGGSMIYSATLDRLVGAGYVMVRGDVATLTEKGRAWGLELLEQATQRFLRNSSVERVLRCVEKGVTHVVADGVQIGIRELDLPLLNGYLEYHEAGLVLTDLGREVLDRDGPVSTEG